MTKFADLPSVLSNHLLPFTDQLQLAAAAYLARFKGASRDHTESDLRCYLAWEASGPPPPATAVMATALPGLRVAAGSASRLRCSVTRLECVP